MPLSQRQVRANPAEAHLYIRGLNARIRELERALRPFAKEADEWSVTISEGYKPGVSEPGHKQVYAKAVFSIGDCRRAKRLLDNPR